MCYAKYEAREQVCRNLPNNKLTRISDIAGRDRNIHWKEKGKEFRYNGNMYDVVRTLKKGDTTIYYCYADVRESKLISEIDKQVNDYLKAHPTESQKGNNLLKKVMGLFYISTSDDLYKILNAGETLTILMIVHFPDSYTGIKSPPPKEPFSD